MTSFEVKVIRFRCDKCQKLDHSFAWCKSDAELPKGTAENITAYDCGLTGYTSNRTVHTCDTCNNDTFVYD